MFPRISPFPRISVLVVLILGLSFTQYAFAQKQRRPARAPAPKFDEDQYKGIFFSDVTAVLKGELPTKRASIAAAPSAGQGSKSEAASEDADDPMAWKNIISPVSLEDLVKSSKLKLDRIVTTPTAFAGGGYQEARTEFGILAMLFAIIEVHPEDVRWKSSASLAREMMARTSANAKIGSRQVFDEAKKRKFDLEDLLGGSKLQGTAKTETDWSNLIDRVPLMRVLETAHGEHVSKYVSNEQSFEENKSDLLKYSELIAALGKTSLAEDMPDATDEDYQVFAKEMIKQAQQVALAVKTNNADMARQASGQIGQSCTNCHDNFR